MSEKITWLASYPKSGNTWVRALLTSYRNGGRVDINDLDFAEADNYQYFTRAVCPLDLCDISYGTKLLLRPAALLHQMVGTARRPLVLKTHHCNGTPAGLPPLIPPGLTERAIYIVRDPRDVALGLSRHVNVPISDTISNMNNPGYGIGREDDVIPHHLSTWTQHVRSWMNCKSFPVLIVRYEDLCRDPSSEFIQILEFCDIEVDKRRVRLAVDSCHFDKLRAQEDDNGFKESKHGIPFFFKGKTAWFEYLSDVDRRRIEKDHGEIMRMLDYEILNEEVSCHE